MAWVTVSLPGQRHAKSAGSPSVGWRSCAFRGYTDGQLSTAAGRGKESKVSSLPIRHALGPILTAPLLAACAGAYPPPGPGVIEFANPYQFRVPGARL